MIFSLPTVTSKASCVFLKGLAKRGMEKIENVFVTTTPEIVSLNFDQAKCETWSFLPSFTGKVQNCVRGHFSDSSEWNGSNKKQTVSQTERRSEEGSGFTACTCSDYNLCKFTANASTTSAGRVSVHSLLQSSKWGNSKCLHVEVFWAAYWKPLHHHFKQHPSIHPRAKVPGAHPSSPWPWWICFFAIRRQYGVNIQ